MVGEHKLRLVKCIYEKSEKNDLIRALVTYLRRGFSRESGDSWGALIYLGLLAFSVLVALKNQGFREEQEWRLVGFDLQKERLKLRQGRFGVVPYCALPLCPPGKKLSLCRVYVGPNEQPVIARAAAQALVHLHARDFPKVIVSETSWRVETRLQS